MRLVEVNEKVSDDVVEKKFPFEQSWILSPPVLQTEFYAFTFKC